MSSCLRMTSMSKSNPDHGHGIKSSSLLDASTQLRMGNTQSALGLATETVIGQDRPKPSPSDTHHWTGSTLSLNSSMPRHGSSLNEKGSSSVAYAPEDQYSDDDSSIAYQAFVKLFPEYQLTWILDTLRRTDYSRLDCSGETYVDYMGGALYPESLIRVHANFLGDNILGNTHSISNSSKLSAKCTTDARAAVLSFFQAPPEYACVFTSNASTALKLVGESFPFAKGSSFVLGVDSHNSVNGLREFASRGGARVCYIESTNRGGFDTITAKKILRRNKPPSGDRSASLFALTGQSNISNTKNPLSILQYASSLGYYTLLDAAALAPTTPFSLSDTPVDAMAISFYKMFGFPTGVGALVAKKSFLDTLERPWFSGGNVNVVQVPGNLVTRTHESHERFEDGTINYLTLPAITDGLTFLSAYLPFLPLRLSCLMHFLTSSLMGLRHGTTDTPVVRILSRMSTRRLKSVGEKSDTGSTVSLVFLSPSGDILPLSFIEYSAAQESISLRTGCMCNPGAAAALLGRQGDMEHFFSGMTKEALVRATGQEFGVVRISLGLASSFQDVWNVLRFAAGMANHKTRLALWDRWRHSPSVARTDDHH